MEASMKGSGSMIYRMDWAKRPGRTNQRIKDSISRGKNMGRVLMFGQMEVYTVAAG
jgi:hypothetical protein